MKSKNYLYIGIILFCSWSCRDVIQLELREQTGKLVVEGLLTDQAGPHQIKLSTTVSYYSTDDPPVVEDAIVELYNEENELLTNFTFDNELQAYVSPGNFRGELGNFYTFRITYQNEIYESSSRLLENGRLDSIYYFFVPEIFFRPEGYYVYVDGVIPKNEKRFFRWMVYQNDTLKDGRGDYFIFDNELLQEEINFFELPYAFKLGDTVLLESYSINEDMFTYYNEFVSLLFNDGGIFSPPPVNPTSNVHNITNPENYPLGFIQVSSLIRKEIIIEEEADAAN